MARITFVLSCLVISSVLVSVDAGCEWYDNCGACVADSGCGWCSNDPKGVGTGVISSKQGNGGLDASAVNNEGGTVPFGTSTNAGIPQVGQLVNVRGQYKEVSSASADTLTFEDNYEFEGTGYISSPYYAFTSHDNTRGKQIVGMHKTKFLTELKAGYTVKPYNEATSTVLSVNSDTHITTTTPLAATFSNREYQIGNYRIDGSISYPDTSKTSLHGSYQPSPTKFTSQLKDGYVISTGSSDHSDPASPARVAQVVHDQLVVLSAKFIATFESEPIWVELGGRGTGTISGTSGSSRITGSDPCAQGHPCHPPTRFLEELRVGDIIEIDDGNATHAPFYRTIHAIQDDAHLTLSECLAVTTGVGSNGASYTDASGNDCMEIENAGEGARDLPITSKFKIRTFRDQPYTYARAVAGKVKSEYVGESSRAAIPVTVDETSMGGSNVSLTHTIGAGYAVIVQVTGRVDAETPPVYERRMVKRVVDKNTFIIDRKFTKAFDNTLDNDASTNFWFESCPSLTYENFDQRIENGPGVISGMGARYTYDNTQYAEITSTTANFQIHVRVGYEIILRNTGVKRRITKIVTNTKIHVNRPFNDYVNNAPVGFSNHAYQIVVRKGYDKNGLVVDSEGYDKHHAYGSDFHMHWKPGYNTGGSNSRQQGAVTNQRQMYSHQMKSSTTSSGAGILSQDPYLLYPPVCYNNGRCVPKTSHSLVGVENIIKLGGSDRLGAIVSSSTSNAVHDLVSVGDTSMWYNDCKPVCTITACKDGVCETRQVVGTTTAHNSTHLYTELPFTYNGTGALSQYQNNNVPGFVPEGTTAYNAMAGVQFRVRYVTATGTVHWCPNGIASGASCDPYTLTGSSKETKTKFRSETSNQWSVTIPCDGDASLRENRTISSINTDTSLTVHDTFANSNNKKCYTIGNIPALGRVTSPQGSFFVHGDEQSRFVEQLKVGYTVTIGNIERTITTIKSNTKLEVNAGFTGGVNTKTQMYFSGRRGTGEVSTSAGSTAVIGTLDVTQTKFDEELAIGYMVMVGKDYKVVTAIDSPTTLKVDLAFELMTHQTSGQTYGYYKNSYNYESCFTYEVGDFAEEHEYETKHVYVEDACEIKPGCCGFKITSVVYPDKWAYYKIRPSHSNQNIRVVATTIEDNIDLVIKKDATPTTSSYDYTSVRESNPWELTVPQDALTCGESYVGYNVSSSLGTQDHITAPAHGTTDDTTPLRLDADALDLTPDSSYAPSNCSWWYIGVRGDNRYPQKTGASEYDLLVYTEFEWPHFQCADAGIYTSQGSADAPKACKHLGLTANEDAQFVLNTDDNRAVMRLTPNTNMRKGSAWYSTKVHIYNGFETEFQFRMAHFTVGCNSVKYPSGFCGGGDGFAFLIHDKHQGHGDRDIGCYGAGLGYGTVVAADQGDDWARPRCLTYDAATASNKCDSGCDAGNGADRDIYTGCTQQNGLSEFAQDDGIFGEPCAKHALCDPLDNGCGGTCGMPSCETAISRVVAVEFDTWNNLNLHDPKQGVSMWWINATQFVGHNDNHVAIFSSDSTYGTSTDHASPNHFAATPSIPNLADGKNHTVKIKYWPQKASHTRVLKKGRGAPHTTAITTSGDCLDNSGATDASTRRAAPDACFPGKFANTAPGNLAVFIDDMKRPVLQTKITLRKGVAAGDCHDNDIDRCMLDAQGNAYIGFSAATGGERTGVTMNSQGVTKTLHQSLPTGSSNGVSNSAMEAAALQVGAAQTHEILYWKFCNNLGCSAAGAFGNVN